MEKRHLQYDAPRTAHSVQPDPIRAVEEVSEALQPDSGDTVIAFVSSLYGGRELSSAISRSLPKSTYGCTTSGEIGDLGYRDHSVTAICLPKDVFYVSVICIESDRPKIDYTAIQPPNGRPGFVMSFLDGMSGSEEQLLSSFYQQYPFEIVGGSAGDDLAFKQTAAVFQGQVQPGFSLFLHVETELPFRLFKESHFSPGDVRMVTTEADPLTRTVFELNGEPAAKVYADLLDMTVDELCPEVFAMHPVTVGLGGEVYVRSIQRANADLSLTFYCAIEDGIVLRLARRGDIVDNLKQLADRLTQPRCPIATLVFECILRKFEIQELNLKGPISEQIRRLHGVGFHTYGEQYSGIHINQTITGVAFYDAE